MIPPNYRLINDSDDNLESRENPNINCLSCYFYTEHQSEGFCARYRYSVMKMHTEEQLTGVVSYSYMSMPVTKKYTVYDSPKTICDYYLPRRSIKKEVKFPVCWICFISLFLIGALNSGIGMSLGGGIEANNISARITLIVVIIFLIISLFLRKKLGKDTISTNNSILQTHDQKVNTYLNTPFHVSLQKIYQLLRINSEEFARILNALPANLSQLSESEILVDNHSRVEFFLRLDNAYQTYLANKTKIVLQPNPDTFGESQQRPAFCDKCGSKLGSAQVFCPTCGNQIFK
jgi:preprotein translocase subunit SecG